MHASGAEVPERSRKVRRSHWKRATKLLTFTAESTASAMALVAHDAFGALHAHTHCWCILSQCTLSREPEPVRIPVNVQRFVGGAARSDSPDNEHKSYQGHSEQEDTPESNTYCCSLRLSVHGGLGKRGPGACLHHDA